MNFKSVYFPVEDIVTVRVYDGVSSTYSAKHIGFAYKRQGGEIPFLYAIVKDKLDKIHHVRLDSLFTPTE